MPSSDDFARKVRRFTGQLTDNIRALEQTPEISAVDSLSPAFMAQHTPFPNVEALLQQGLEPPKTLEGFFALSREARDAFVRTHTAFPDWRAMQIAAAKAWVEARFTQGL